ncbi:MAG TPA: hypothetical protein VM367_11125 [Pseudonocardia sp.]|jgi:hypothetical protein|nr:hypothetical protein [Pseudonocardia sp.]
MWTARGLTARGIEVLRLDFTGLGESGGSSAIRRACRDAPEPGTVEVTENGCRPVPVEPAGVGLAGTCDVQRLWR